MGKFWIDKFKSQLSGPFQSIETVVETGTFKGDSTRVMAKHFKKVFTIELDENLYKSTKSQVLSEGFENIEFIFGDSGEKIEELTKELTDPAIFFLDAHWSGDKSVDWQKSEWDGYGVNTAHLGESDKPSGEEQVPLNREMRAIADNFESYAVIYIDDLKNFDFWGKGKKDRAFKGEDYSHIDLRDFKKILGHRIKEWINTDEQLIIKLDRKAISPEEEERQKKYYNTVLPRKTFIRNFVRVLKRIFVYPFKTLYWKIVKSF